MRKEEIPFLNQLVNSLEQAGERLENDFDIRNFEGVAEDKKIILNIFEKIEEILK